MRSRSAKLYFSRTGARSAPWAKRHQTTRTAKERHNFRRRRLGVNAATSGRRLRQHNLSKQARSSVKEIYNSSAILVGCTPSGIFPSSPVSRNSCEAGLESANTARFHDFSWKPVVHQDIHIQRMIIKPIMPSHIIPAAVQGTVMVP